MKKIIFFFVLATVYLNAQQPVLRWAKHFDGSGQTIGMLVATDKARNVYTAGTFTNIVDLDPGPATFNHYSAGGEDIFVVKMSATGKLMWVRSIGGTMLDRPTTMEISPLG